MFNRIHIIIPVLGSSSWTGGFTYQANLIEALKTRPDVSIYLVRNLDQTYESIEPKSLSGRIFHFISQIKKTITNKFSLVVRGYNRELTKKINRYTTAQINVLFTHNNAHLLSRNNILKLYWIPDFQHVHMSYFFSQEEINERNQRFLHGCEHADIVIVSSKNAQKDLAEFAPQYLSKSRISNFVSNVSKGIWELNPDHLLSKYSIPEKFFYLPNQFWKHKNHVLVFEAMHILQAENIFPVLICTGNPADYRNPEYSNEIKTKIDEWKLKDQLFILGLVDHNDVLLLIRQCIALINPSLFEGWSTTVEECKSIGKRAILSDIEVHKEQNPPLSDFFDPKDAKSLAEILKKRWHELQPGPDLKLEENAKKSLPERMNNYANNFVNIIKESYTSRK
ncbi:MAG TPA: glycosyltransferase family 1 protein [Bacteroidia bacterium]|nr:glycosyltransferase family 1 protein [Bacteroidia bacterium]